MAFKLDKEESKMRELLIGELQEKAKAVHEAFGALQNAVTEYNQLVQQAEALRETVHDRLQDEFDEKSEKWQEGDKAAEAQELIEAWDSESFTEIDEIEEPELEHAETLEGLSTGI